MFDFLSIPFTGLPWEIVTHIQIGREEPNIPLQNWHCMKIVRIWSFSGPYFLKFGLNTEEKYGPEKLGIRRLFSQCGLSEVPVAVLAQQIWILKPMRLKDDSSIAWDHLNGKWTN